MSNAMTGWRHLNERTAVIGTRFRFLVGAMSQEIPISAVEILAFLLDQRLGSRCNCVARNCRGSNFEYSDRRVLTRHRLAVRVSVRVVDSAKCGCGNVDAR